MNNCFSFCRIKYIIHNSISLTNVLYLFLKRSTIIYFQKNSSFFFRNGLTLAWTGQLTRLIVQTFLLYTVHRTMCGSRHSLLQIRKYLPLVHKGPKVSCQVFWPNIWMHQRYRVQSLICHLDKTKLLTFLCITPSWSILTII